MKDITVLKPKKLIYVIGDMSQRKRIIYNYFLSLITTTKTDKKGYYYTTIANIKNVCNINNYEVIRGILKNLQHTSLDIDILKSKIYVNLIGEIIINDKNIVKLFFTPTIIELANEKNSYKIISITELTKLKSKYSITLYEMIQDYYRENNSRMQVPDLTIEEFRALMGVQDKYKKLSELKRNVISKILIDINDLTDFNLKYEILKKGGNTKPTHIRFNFRYIKNSSKTAVKNVEEKLERKEILNAVVEEQEYQDNKKFGVY
jgi:plasmid replication initiation protein